MCLTSQQHCSQLEKSVNWKKVQVHLCSKRTGPLSRTVSGKCSVSYLRFTVVCDYNQNWLSLFCVAFGRIISTCGELLRQCGAFEQQLSNKYDFLFSFHTPGFSLTANLLNSKMKLSASLCKMFGRFAHSLWTFLILLIGYLVQQVSIYQSHTAHAAWLVSRRPALQRGRAPPRTPGKSTTTFRGETWLSTTAWWKSFTP